MVSYQALTAFFPHPLLCRVVSRKHTLLPIKSSLVLLLCYHKLGPVPPYSFPYLNRSQLSFFGFLYPAPNVEPPGLPSSHCMSLLRHLRLVGKAPDHPEHCNWLCTDEVIWRSSYQLHDIGSWPWAVDWQFIRTSCGADGMSPRTQQCIYAEVGYEELPALLLHICLKLP